MDERRRSRASEGQALKQIRLQLGLTQRDLAEQLGLSKSTIGNYENGRNGIPSEVMRSVASLAQHVEPGDMSGLPASPEDLAAMSLQDPENPTPSRAVHDVRAQRVKNAFGKMSAAVVQFPNRNSREPPNQEKLSKRTAPNKDRERPRPEDKRIDESKGASPAPIKERLNSRQPLTTLERIGLFSRRVQIQKNKWPLPAKIADLAIYFVFMCSATVFVIEQVQRRGPDALDQGRFQDLLFIGSFATCVVLFVPVCFSLFFGSRQNQKEKRRDGPQGRSPRP